MLTNEEVKDTPAPVAVVNEKKENGALGAAPYGPTEPGDTIAGAWPYDEQRAPGGAE